MNPGDRCDRCGAEAFVLVRVVAGVLLFCGHHFAVLEAPLRRAALFVGDDRERINARPSLSSA